MSAKIFFLMAASVMLTSAAVAEGPRWVVMDARGAGLKPGDRLDGQAVVTLKEGERATLIGPDGKTLSLRGAFSGTPLAAAGPPTSSSEALAALLTIRDARVSAIGVVRAGLDAAPLPDAWLLDAARGGARCLREGLPAVFWRPQAAKAARFSIAPADRTWVVEMPWPARSPTLKLPREARITEQNLVHIALDGEEQPIALNVIPAGLDAPMVLAAWMMEKGCLSQADALLRDMKWPVTR